MKPTHCISSRGPTCLGLGMHFLEESCSELCGRCLKKNQNAPRPSEHPPVRGKKCQNVLGPVCRPDRICS